MTSTPTRAAIALFISVRTLGVKEDTSPASRRAKSTTLIAGIPGIAGCTSSCDQIEAGTAVHAGVTDCRSNAPEIALGRPLLVENRHCESCSCLRALHAKKSWCP